MAALDQETIEMFATTLRGVLSATAGDTLDDASDRLEEVGWRDVLAEDERAIVPVFFRLQGELLARSSALDDVALRSVGGGVAFVHPRPGRASAGTANGGLAADGLEVDGIAFHDVPDGPYATTAVIDGQPRVVSVAAANCAAKPIEGMDPSLRLHRVTGSVAADAVTVVDDVDALDVQGACRRALAYELLGVTNAMLVIATEHARTRVQYGQPIGAFQAVKHRLADVLVAVQAAAVVADEAWDSDVPLAAAAAKCLAGRAYRLAAENCLQVMGAIGFTWEHDLHRFIRRGLVLDVLYGSARELRTEIGRTLVARGHAARLGRL